MQCNPIATVHVLPMTDINWTSKLVKYRHEVTETIQRVSEVNRVALDVSLVYIRTVSTNISFILHQTDMQAKTKSLPAKSSQFLRKFRDQQNGQYVNKRPEGTSRLFGISFQ